MKRINSVQSVTFVIVVSSGSGLSISLNSLSGRQTDLQGLVRGIVLQLCSVYGRANAP